ncbi:primosomal protein N' [Coxiella endosymbiont of Amblyomma nuttalli]|uniref:primosomal protein N' n=1 Tax=Coxiella endosymbiont of Amblyomma nuttalli TaxID=2749996 RepID=UPI001BAC149F|nr:primosomal protein N' [Coxiella endosymbiont of Amblyomma nuttalli]QTS84206.1 Primosomal protein N' [Coxiella endosymbiont of Amblyomma nuttalli]
MSTILQVAIPIPIYQCFDYLIPESIAYTQLRPGMFLKVPFGHRKYVGVLLDLTSYSSLPTTRLRAIHAVLDREPLPLSLLQLCRFASNYYHYPIGEVILGTLPRLIRQGKKIDNGKIDSYSMIESPKALELNFHQQHAVDEIVKRKEFQTYLLAGVTGSGKTEVYLHCIEKIIQQNKQVLILIPEIGLTPQTLKRFRERFNVPIVVLHSSLTDKKRAQAWLMAKNGIAKIVIGTRSTIFTPLLSPGMIVLDEEHDLAFKQQSGFRYSARDLAVIRSRIENIPIILGTATPSFESFYNVEHKRYQLLSLPNRAGNAHVPTVTVIDLRKKKLIAGMSEDLLFSIEKHIKNNGQVLLFLNRRGYAPTLLCRGCGWITHCHRCDARLTLHSCPKRLYCHHCGVSKSIPLYCSQCRYYELIEIGLGTEQLELRLQERFPDYSIVRIDRDNTRTKNSMEDKLDLIHNRGAPILIGTQMIVKGHHFTHLTLVAIIDADSAWYGTDFRTAERMGQLLTQVSGRAGRVEQRGEVFIQTHYPDNPFLIILLKEGYEAFTKALLNERKMAALPPYAHLALLRAEAVRRNLPNDFLITIRQKLTDIVGKEVNLLGPVPAVMERKAGRYRYQLLFQSKSRTSLHKTLKKLITLLANQRMQVRWSLDVDPQETV